MTSQNLKVRNELLPTLARTSPSIIPIGILLYCLSDPSYHSFYIMGLFVINFVLNPVLKNFIVKPIYKLTGKTEFPIFGIGNRPEGATSCSLSLDNIKSTSFGMPSGHSQIIWSIGTYLLCRAINNINNKLNSTTWSVLSYIWSIIYCILLLSVMIYVPYSRVYIEGCHTLQQVIVGGIIGAGFGILAFFMEDTIINSMQ